MQNELNHAKPARLMSRDPNLNPDDEPAWKRLTGGWAISGMVSIFLIMAFYVEEDWRGEAYWNQAQEEAVKEGESLDQAKFIPPPVPDEKNFGVLPIFEMEPESASGYSRDYLVPIGMNRAFARVPPDAIPTSKDDNQGHDELPYLGNWAKGEQADLPAIKKRLADLCHRELPEAHLPPKASPADMFGLLCPALADLRAADAPHPLCRFDEDYTSGPPASRPLGGIVSPIRMAKVLSYEERLAILGDQPQLALDDMKVGWKVDSGVRQEPLLIAGLVSMGVVAIQMGVVTEGLARHVWNDSQLEEIDHDLAKIDDLKESQFCIRGETAVYSVPNTDFLKENRLKIREEFPGPMTSASLGGEMRDFLFSTTCLLVPDGWFDDFKADEARFELLGTVKMVDPVLHRAFPEKKGRALHLIQDVRATSYWRDFLITMASPTLDSIKRFAYQQTQIDQARISCRLERYRLAQGKYPEALSDLSPTYGTDVPNDVMIGQPYHYKPLSDGTYLLYSVGWDQVDDGGRQAVASSGYHYFLNDPDWVWPNHPEIKKSN
jgi:hypothetical protein